MSRNRLIFLFLMGCYLGFMVDGQALNAVIVTSIGLVVTVAIFTHLLFGPARSFPRRLCAMTADITTICTVLHLGGETTSCFVPLVLWTVFGNGLRFGRRSLLRAMAFGLIGLSAVVVTTPFWRENLPLSVGTLVAVVLLPLYSLSLLDRLSAATRQAEAANEAKTMFLAKVSHEMRTPLHAIVGMGSLLESLKLPPEAAEMVHTIMDAADRLTEFIDDLLGVTASETGGFHANIDAFSVIDLLTEVRALSQAQADAKNLRMSLHIEFGTPIRLSGDKRHLRQVLLNLVSNALKFTEQGGVLIVARALKAGSSQVLLRFEVVDTGIGIAPAALNHIFEPFVQADRSITERFGGTGLGLAICKQIVEGLDGSIGAESRVGVGTTIWLEVHCDVEAVPEQEEAAQRGLIAVLSMGAPIHEDLRSTVLKCRSDAVFFDSRNSSSADILAEVIALQRPVLLTQPESRDLVETIEAVAAELPISRSPALVLIASPHADPITPGLTWMVRTWLPADFSESQLSTALRTAAELSTFDLRSAGDATTTGSVKGAASSTTLALRGERHDVGHQITSTRPLSVLVADDSKVNQRVVAKILQTGGHNYELVDDGDMALDAMTDGRFDVVLMDVNMPNTNGLDATKLYRMGALGMPWLPILGLTADATAEMERSCLEAGMDSCLVKPVRADVLLDAIDEAVRAVATQQPEKPAHGSLPSPSLNLVQTPILDDKVLTSLRSIAGVDADNFLAQIMTEYFTEVEIILAHLEAAIARGSVGDVRFHAHAVASISGNVGAARLKQLVQAIECMRPDEIRTSGQHKTLMLRRELAELRIAWDQKTFHRL